MQDWDVVVVGGGPAGVSAAKSVARLGGKVVLFERHPYITSTKPCGEATSKATFATAGVQEKPTIVLRNVKARVHGPNLRFIEIDQVGYCINKSLFVQEIAIQAAELGAQFRVREEVQQVTMGNAAKMKVKTTHGEYSASVVIAADGYNSCVAKNLGITEKSEPIPTIQYVMANCDLEDTSSVRFYLGREVAPGGYAWIFPKADRVAGVGVGTRGAPAKQCLDTFVKKFKRELGASQIIDYRGALVPIGGMINKNVVDGAIIVGDAAGTVIPFTGAGIHSSIAAGSIAGEVATSAAQAGDNSASRLEEFNVKYRPWRERITRSLKAMRAVEKLTDTELNMLQEILSPDDILDLSNGMNIKRVARKLLSHPVLAVKLAKTLL